MLFPADPDRRPALWESLRAQLSRDAMCVLVANGHGDAFRQATVMAVQEVEATITRMRAASVRRIGANRETAIAPHFAAMVDGERATLVELITYPSLDNITVDERQLRNDLGTVAITLMFELPQLRSLRVPLAVAPWTMQDFDIRQTGPDLVFEKRMI